MAVQNAVGDAFRGATWVALHNGGGCGWCVFPVWQITMHTVNIFSDISFYLNRILWIFLFTLTESSVVTFCWNRLDETIPTNGNNIGIG